LPWHPSVAAPVPMYSIDPLYPHWFRCDLCGLDVAQVLPAEALDLVNLTAGQVVELCPDAEAEIDGHEHDCPAVTLAAYVRYLAESHQAEFPRELLAMPNHWHLVLWPRKDNDLSEYMHWLTMTHTQRWHAHHHTAGPALPGSVQVVPGAGGR